VITETSGRGVKARSTGEARRESGKGVDAGDMESFGSGVAGRGAGEGLCDTAGVDPLDASPIAKLARRRSSRLDLSLLEVSGRLVLFGRKDWAGLAERREPNDFLRFESADSASSVEESACNGRGLCVSAGCGEEEVVSDEALTWVSCEARRGWGAARVSTAIRSPENMFPDKRSRRSRFLGHVDKNVQHATAVSPSYYLRRSAIDGVSVTHAL
jgi:hypothetical protein